MVRRFLTVKMSLSKELTKEKELDNRYTKKDNLDSSSSSLRIVFLGLVRLRNSCRAFKMLMITCERT